MRYFAAILIFLTLMTTPAIADNAFTLTPTLSDNTAGTRFGYETPAFEIGVEATALLAKNPWDKGDQKINDTYLGLYARKYFDLGGNYVIRPFAGVAGGAELKTRGWRCGPEVGVVVPLHKNVAIVPAYQYRFNRGDLAKSNADGGIWSIGLKIRLK